MVKSIHIALSFLFCILGICQAQEKEIISRLSSVSKQLDWKEPDFSELEPLLRDRKIVALGEGTHGTKEFEELFSRLMQFNIEKLGYTAIAFEGDHLATKPVNDYITSKVDQLKTAGFPMSEERRGLFEWIRKWNALLGKDEIPVEVFGLEVRNLKGAIDHIVSRCAAAGIDTSSLKPFLATGVLQINKNIYQDGTAFLAQLLENEDIAFDKNDRHLVMMALQTINHQYRQQTAFNKARYIGIRDQSMADNACWILDSTSHEKLVIWAHSGHTAKADIFGEAPMGKYLHDRFGNGYLAVGTTFGSGDVNLFVKENNQYTFGHRHFELPTDNNTYEYYFSKVEPDTFFIDLSKILDEDPLYGFFNKKRKFRFIGGTADAKHDQNVRLAQLFDVLIYIPTSSLMVAN